MAKVLLDSVSRVLVETPTYPGALGGPSQSATMRKALDVADLVAKRAGARFLYVLPELPEPDRPHHKSEARRELGPPIIEDDP